MAKVSYAILSNTLRITEANPMRVILQQIAADTKSIHEYYVDIYSNALNDRKAL